MADPDRRQSIVCRPDARGFRVAMESSQERLGLTGVRTSRARLVSTTAGGIGYRLSSGLDFSTSASAQTRRDDHQETITIDVRLRF